MGLPVKEVARPIQKVRVLFMSQGHNEQSKSFMSGRLPTVVVVVVVYFTMLRKDSAPSSW
jgi:hypothetical protein